MELLTKLFFRPIAPDLLCLPPDSFLQPQVAAHGEPSMAFLVRPNGAHHVQAACGGAAAWDLAALGPAAHANFTTGRLVALFGSAARNWVPANAWAVSGWAQDAHFLGRIVTVALAVATRAMYLAPQSGMVG